MNEKKIRRDIRGCKIVQVVAAIGVMFPTAGAVIMCVLINQASFEYLANHLQLASLLILAGLLCLVMALGLMIVTMVTSVLQRQGEQTLQLIEMVRGGQAPQIPGQV